jgi:DNA-binding NarL/FixJ family response regulator
MLGRNGYEFVKQVKKTNPQVKVKFMTAFDIDDKEFQCFAIYQRRCLSSKAIFHTTIK